MTSTIQQAVASRDRSEVEKYFARLKKLDYWSLVSIVDEVSPFALMESNLPYGSFHRIKMALFMRWLARKGLFSKDTEFAMARLISLDLADREWVGIAASDQGVLEKEGDYLEKMIDELNSGNSHNAFYYALGCLGNDPDLLIRTLLELGSVAVPNSLGHSISCFWPVVMDLIYTNHKYTYTGLLSFIMYLSRFQYGDKVLEEDSLSSQQGLDHEKFLAICASGGGIVNLHHMITFYITEAWQQSTLCPGKGVPWKLIRNWVGDKELDGERFDEMKSVEPYPNRIGSYEEFSQLFDLRQVDQSVRVLLSLLEKDPQRGIDWVFRLYTSYYTADWDPHYITGLYCAIQLHLGNGVSDKTASRMAIDQTVRYFAKGKLDED